MIRTRDEWLQASTEAKIATAKALYAAHDGNASKAGDSIGLERTTLLKWFKRVQENSGGEPITISSDRSVDVATKESLLIQHGYNPDDYEEISSRINQWGDPDGTTSHQIRINVRPRAEALLRPALERTPGWSPPKPNPVKGQAVERIMLVSDPHCPLDETTLTDASVELARLIQPTKIVQLGDSMDNSPFSRHRKNPRHDLDYSTQDCVDSTYKYLARLADAAPNAERVILAGNHDWWLYHRVLEQLPQLATLNVACSSERFLSFERLLRLDEIGWTLESTGGGDYHDSTHQCLNDLVAIHGVKTGKHGGAMVEIMGWHGTSVAQGHDHKTALVRHVKRLPNGSEAAYWSWSLGAMSRRDLGYTHTRDVHQSFGVVTVWPDGRWQPELAVYDPQHDDVTYRDWRYTNQA